MEATYENRWCKYCISKTKQKIVHSSKIQTYKRRKQYKCTICGHTSWLRGYRPFAESVY